MPRGGAHFGTQELIKVLSCYDIGPVLDIKPLSIGNRRAPKVVITTENGKYLLKRRSPGKDDLYRVAFAHAVQNYLFKKNYPVTSLIPTRGGKVTVLSIKERSYELFGYVDGARYDASVDATIEAGRQLAFLHKYLADFISEFKTLRGIFHDSTPVRKHLKSIGLGSNSNGNGKLIKIVDDLMVLYNQASTRVNELGFDSWAEQVIHGDWHPGNILFKGKKIVAVLDFDSVRFAPPVIDLANGILQFSIVGGRPNPIDWPAYCDQEKLVHFLMGYREIIPLEGYQTTSLIDLMIETMIAEAVLPIAATGFFGNLSGLDFLQMICRKTGWLDRNRKKLNEAIKNTV
ncbi:MAG: phosphotransferase enzyme family protein [Planctomycetota bacterium]|jgi:homoserine kinase type II